MRNDTELTEAGRQYAAAYAAHYAGHDLPLALQLYKKVMASHPSAPEAGYSLTQVQNIFNAVVPKQELLDAQMALALACLEQAGRTYHFYTKDSLQAFEKAPSEYVETRVVTAAVRLNGSNADTNNDPLGKGGR